MLSETISQDVKMKFHPFQDVFVSSVRKEISVSERLERWSLSIKGKTFEKPFFVIPNLSSILQIDYSSSIYRYLEFKTETALTEEFFRGVEQIKVLEKISRICDKLLEEKPFREIDRTKLLKTISEILNEIPSEKLKISEGELSKRLRGVLAVEAASGILNELTPEQIKGFDEAVKRRPFFK